MSSEIPSVLQEERNPASQYALALGDVRPGVAYVTYHRIDDKHHGEVRRGMFTSMPTYSEGDERWTVEALEEGADEDDTTGRTGLGSKTVRLYDLRITPDGQRQFDTDVFTAAYQPAEDY